MKKIDRRVLRTQQSLGNALVDLTLELGYDAITIKELTQRANIGYATFFRHFKSKDELLLYVLESVLHDINDLTKPEMSPYEQALVTFEYIKEHNRVYHVFISIPRNSELVQTVYESIEKDIRSNYVARDPDRIPIEIAVNHIVTSILELIRWWIVNDMKYPVEQMATIQAEMIVKATEAVALNHVDKSHQQISAD